EGPDAPEGRSADPGVRVDRQSFLLPAPRVVGSPHPAGAGDHDATGAPLAPYGRSAGQLRELHDALGPAVRDLPRPDPAGEPGTRARPRVRSGLPGGDYPGRVQAAGRVAAAVPGEAILQ